VHYINLQILFLIHGIKKICCRCFCDLTKSFASVNHELL
jgi:hypothetical protein